MPPLVRDQIPQGEHGPPAPVPSVTTDQLASQHPAPVPNLTTDQPSNQPASPPSQDRHLHVPRLLSPQQVRYS